MIEQTNINTSKLIDLLVHEHIKVVDFESVAKTLNVDVDDFLDDIFMQLHDEKTGIPLTVTACPKCLCNFVRRLLAVGIEIGRRTGTVQKIQ